MELKLTGIDRFVSPKTNHVLVQRNDKITVSEEDGEYLLDLEFTDALNQSHNFFTDVTGMPVQEKNENSILEDEVAPRRTRRQKA